MTRLNKKRSRRSEIDMISKLPDSLLQHILSFVSTKDAIRTSLLSRRWKNLWMLVPCLDLDTEKFHDVNDFHNSMDRFLGLRVNSRLQKFIVKYNISKRQSSRFKSWIEAAIMCKVEQFELHSYCDPPPITYSYAGGYDGGVGTPQSLCICNTLVVLKVEGLDNFDIPNRVSLPNLKIMHLKYVTFANDVAFSSLISGCPVLEELSVIREYEDNLTVLCICSQTLKQLIMLFGYDVADRNYGVVIDAPNLEYLELYDQDSKNITITKIGSSSLKALISVKFGIYFWEGQEFDDFSVRSSFCKILTAIFNVRSLIIHLDIFEFLYPFKKFEALPQLHNLIHLEAKHYRRVYKLLPTVLECCPNLKSLSLAIYGREKSNPLRLSSVVPQCMLSSLESITLKVPIIGDAIEMEMIKYFLENSAILKKMKIYLSKDLKGEKELCFFKELLMFSRRSTACQVDVEQCLFV